jgi:hypothetical protein
MLYQERHGRVRFREEKDVESGILTLLANQRGLQRAWPRRVSGGVETWAGFDGVRRPANDDGAGFP